MPFYLSSVRDIAAALSAAVLVMMGSTGCHRIDNNRLHVAYVNVTFNSQADWDFYGVHGAGLFKRFILSERIPADFPYTAMSGTGVGGVLLCTTYLGVPVAYDLACPVECRANVRIFINEDNQAECPVCHSRYDVFESLGYPVGGPAAEEGYGLQVYRVGPGPHGEYMTVSI